MQKMFTAFSIRANSSGTQKMKRSLLEQVDFQFVKERLLSALKLVKVPSNLRTANFVSNFSQKTLA